MRNMEFGMKEEKPQMNADRRRLSLSVVSSLPAARCQLPAARSAFTLVELLVVITIIGILAGLIGVVAFNAMVAARNSRIKAEIGLMDAAMKQFKEKYGNYPPMDLTFSGGAPKPEVQTFLANAFGRYNPHAGGMWVKFSNDLTQANVSKTVVDPARALAFWLSGFSPDVTDPFVGGGTKETLFEFDRSRLIKAATAPGDIANANEYRVYVPAINAKAPYVYFDSRNYGSLTAATPFSSGQAVNNAETGAGAGNATPYARDLDKTKTVTSGDEWVNPDSFQIISAGQDGSFGSAAANTVKLYPDGISYSLEDNDNIINAGDQATLEDAKP